jgi:uncharacterized membrane protein
LIQWVHIAFAALCIFASLRKNLLVWQPTMSAQDIAIARRFDKLSASMAGLLVVSGLSMILWLAKPSGLYLASSLFWLKMTLFVIASALVIWTKVDFKNAAASGSDWSPPARVRVILGFDLIGLFALAAMGRWLAAGVFI